MNDKTFLTLLERDPERAMETLVAQYTGLLWSVAARRLTDPEDIRDCVNETFFEFYIHRERFAPEKGSLKGYLSVIADRLAVKRYWQLCREQSAGQTQPPPARDDLDELELKADLEAALEQLDPVDAEIIRKKYYGGMTVQEIAAALNIPYETVKKRHQRSLQKLRKAMTIGLLLAVLAALLGACAYLVLRYFGIVPGYGVSTSAQSGIYVLEEPAAVETGEYTFSVTDSWWNDGLLTLRCTMTLPQDSPNVEPFMKQLGIALELEGLADGTPLKTSTARLDPRTEYVELYFHGALPEGTRGELSLTLTGAAQPLSLTLRRAGNEVSYDQAGYFLLTEDQGGLLAVPRLEEGNLLVSIYPLNEGDFVTDPGLTKAFGELAAVTVTDADGAVRTGTPVGWHPFGSESYFDWDFGPAPAGTYTLNVPYLYQSLAQDDAETVTIPLTAGADELVQAELPFGVLHLGAQEPLEDYDYWPYRDDPVLAAMGAAYDRFSWWTMTARAECTAPERSFANLPLTAQSGESITLEVNGVSVDVATYVADLIQQEDGALSGLRLGCYPGVEQAAIVVKPGMAYYRWDHPFQIQFEVEE